MSMELQLLVCAVALTVIQMLVSVIGATQQVGLPALAANREGLAEVTGWAGPWIGCIGECSGYRRSGLRSRWRSWTPRQSPTSGR